jgi:hypothetical protein
MTAQPLWGPDHLREPRRLRVLTNSEEKCWRACQRKHHFAYRLGWRPIEKPKPMRFGTLFHFGLEEWWRTGADLDRALRLMVSKCTTMTDKYELAQAYALLIGYHERWRAMPYRTIAVEKKFVCAMTHPVTEQSSSVWGRSGKLDAIAEAVEEDEVFFVEHKTSAEDIEMGSSYWKRLRLDTQVSTYYVGMASLGYDVRRCLYDVVRRPGLEPKMATPVELRKYTKGTKNEPPRLYATQRDNDEAPFEFLMRLMEDIRDRPSYYYQRGFVTRTEMELREARFDTWKIAAQITAQEAEEHYPKNPDACMLYHRQCEYMPVCLGETTIDDPTIYRQVDAIHEELIEGDDTQP